MPLIEVFPVSAFEHKWLVISPKIAESEGIKYWDIEYPQGYSNREKI